MLHERIESSDRADKEDILRVLDEAPEVTVVNGRNVETRKNALQALNGGRTWKDLYDNVFPSLRSGVALYLYLFPVPEDQMPEYLASLAQKEKDKEVGSNQVTDQPVVEKEKELADELGISIAEVEKRGESLHEVNPMMGLRGVRLHVAYPEIADTQYRAIFEAATELIQEGCKPMPEIMIPVTVSARELEFQKMRCEKVRTEIEINSRVQVDYHFGTMIEIPRAALTADRMARTAEFFSFGTNDLTQMTFGFSRDDVGAFMGDYLGHKILDADPFQTIDTKAVGKLVEAGIQGGRSKRPDLKCGICGEHGGDPDSVTFFNKIGLDYVSCSPFRVPIARLAAAQAAIKQNN